MMKYRVTPTAKYRKDRKRAEKQGLNITLLDNAVRILAEGKTLPPEYDDHPLKGARAGYRGCHLLFDWVLVYRIDKDALELFLIETGDHQHIYG